MNESTLQALMFSAILIPALLAGLALLLPKKAKVWHTGLLVLGFAANLALCALLYGASVSFERDWLGFGISFSLRLYQFNGFILLSAAVLSFLVALYTAAFAWKRDYKKQFYAYMLLTIALVNGAVLANSLLVMLFFWEGILGTMFGLILLGGKESFKTSVKAVIIAGVGDLCMMLGIGMAAYLAGTLTMTDIHKLPVTGLGAAAFALLMIGAISKAGSMPFHTWIPDAAKDAPMPFLPFLPGTLEKLLGIYLLTRLCTEFFDFQHGSAMSTVVMTIGVCTILFAVMMALIQKDFKKLLSYHAISQVGYMMLGIGTALPVGLIGGVFHMLNHAAYKCLLFFTAGSVEKQTGTTDLHDLGGLAKKMPVTVVSFLIAAASIAGFPLTNGFYSKELVFDAALESGSIFYIVALLGAFFTAVSFLKLGHAAFFGKEGTAVKGKEVKEAPLPMLVSMVALAALCLGLGIFHKPVIMGLISPTLTHFEEAEHFATHTNWLLVTISCAVLALAALSHFFGYKKTGKGLSAADHFHDAPVLKNVYGLAEKKYFDPYYVGGFAIKAYANASLYINNMISLFYDKAIPRFTGALSGAVKEAHNGNQARYVGWVLFGMVLLAAMFLLFI
ncbi:MAG: proton-conducting transporter membrane subunit [Clostridiaceae bacterium]|nr:hypothetical protein [Eubacteriales bacterium]